MKQKKEILGLNQARAEFDSEMGLEERFELLTKSELQQVKGGVCTTYISSSSSSTPCVPNLPNPCPGDVCGCNAEDGCNFGCTIDIGDWGCSCNYDDCWNYNCRIMWT